ncbi:MAG: 4-coumarate--CoA ligase family protein [Acidimicrobiia bacterium]|jgi:4-coumarate--CoA ligase
MGIVHRSPLPDVAVPDVSITAHVFEHAARHPDRVAMIDGPTGRSYTYSTLQGAVFLAAGGFRERGIGAGDVIGVMAPNVPEYAIAFHGAVSAGGVVTSVNPTYGAEETHFQLVDAGAQLLVTVPAFLGTACEAVAGTAVREILVLGEVPDDAGPAIAPFAALLQAAPLAPVPVQPDDLAALPYSSGTTGLPKGVMLTHRNLVANIVQLSDHLVMDDHEVMMAVLPFFHIYGMQVIMNDGLRRGATLVTMPRFDLEQYLALVQEHRATRLFVVPPMVLALARQPMVDDYDLSSVKTLFSGAAPLGPELAEEAHRRIGAAAMQGYGMTELSPVSHACRLDDAKPGSIGILVASTEARVVDPATGEDLGVGEDGEIWVRGPQVMPGYLHNPEATAATIDADGWLHTGDIGHVEADDFWYVVDRLKELIKVKGFQVPPAELEALLLTHPAVADCAVIGIPDEECGELPKAFVARKPGVDCTAEDLQTFVAGHVATYKRIAVVEFVDAIPKSPSGKILRRMLRDG